MSAQANPTVQELGSIAEWAVRHNISEQGAKARIKVHNIPLAADGKLDFTLADAIWDASSNPKEQARKAKAANGAGGLVPDPTRPVSELGKVQIERERLRIRDAELDLAEREGRLVALDAVRAYESQMFARIRGELLVIGSELRDDLAGMTDPVRIEEVINTRVKQALSKLAGWKPTRTGK